MIRGFEKSVFAVCPDAVGMCNYDVHTGAIVQRLTSHDVIMELIAGVEKISSSSLICDKLDCFHWSGRDYVTKYRITNI